MELIRMDKIAEVKQVVRHENRKRMYEEYQRSGMKVNDWCVMQGLSVKTFYYRLKVIREEMLNETDQHDIVPVMKCKTEMPSEICFGGAENMKMPDNISPEIAAYIRALQTENSKLQNKNS
jgi:hypothetical protein